MTTASESDRMLELYDSCARRLHSYVARRVGSSVADDVVAEAFLILWEQRERHDLASDEVRAWLYGVASNLLRRHARTEETRLRHVAQYAGRQAPSEDPHERIADAIDAGALAGQLGPAVAALRAEEREVLLLTAWSDLSPPEIAAALGIPEATARTRLHRARKRLRREVAARKLTGELPAATTHSTHLGKEGEGRHE